MEPNPLDPARPEREQRPLVLQATELAPTDPRPRLERLPALRLARDKGMQPVGLIQWEPGLHSPVGSATSTLRARGPPQRRSTSHARTPAGGGRRA